MMAAVSIDTAVATLMEVDPEFGMLVEALYGPDVTAEMVVKDVTGVAKAESNKSNFLRRVGLGATLAGVGLAAPELAHAAEEGGFGQRVAGKVAGEGAQKILKPIKAITKPPKVKAGIASGMLLGDLAASHGLKKPQTTPPQPQSNFVKGMLGDSVKAVGRGLKTGIKGYKPSPTFGPVTAERAAQQTKKIEGGRRFANTLRSPGQAVANYPKTTIGGALATGAYLEHRHNTKPVQYNDVYKGDDLTAVGTFSKFDDDQRLAFGWASVVQKDGLPVIDRQDDYIGWEDLEKAAYKYVLSSRVGGDMHRRVGENPHHVSDLVESFVVTPEKIAKMGLPPETPVGWWVGFKVHDDDTWAEVRKGGRTGFSIHGRGKRVETSIDELVAA